MPLFDWPTAEQVREDSALRPEQLGKTVLLADMLADIAQKIQEAGPIVERRILTATSPEPWPFSADDLAIILPKYSADQRQSRQEDQIKVAQKAIALMTLHFLFDRSGSLNSAYQGKADEYKADAEMLLSGSVDGTGAGGLLGELRDLSEAVGDGAPTTPGGRRGACVLLPLSRVPVVGATCPVPSIAINGIGDEFGGCDIWGRYY